jgi:transcriptional regulator with XRE-family HTH domain
VPIITHDQSRQARREFGLSQADVAEATGLKRQYLSEFESDTAQRFTSSQLRKLRTFYEAKLIEARDAGERIDLGFGEENPASGSTPQGITPHPRLVAVQSVRFCFPLSDNVPDDVVAKAMDQIEEGDARLLALFKEQIKREDGFFSDGLFTDDFTALLQEAFSILASNYVLSRMLRGWSAFGVKPVTEDPQTLRDVLAETFKPILVDAGLVSQSADEVGAEEEEVE